MSIMVTESVLYSFMSAVYADSGTVVGILAQETSSSYLRFSSVRGGDPILALESGLRYSLIKPKAAFAISWSAAEQSSEVY
jgi:hypothetical protein